MIDHQWAGIASAAWCCVALLFRSLARGGRRRLLWGFFYIVALVFSLISLTFASHLGGKSVHGDDYLTEFAPPPVREALEELQELFDDDEDDGADEAPSVPATSPSVTPVPPTKTPAAATLPPATAPALPPVTVEPATTQPASTQPVTALPAPGDRTLFASVVQPVFAQHCVECHGPKKVKADLRLDTFAHAMRGGTSESTIVPGSVADSELVRLIRLPATDDDVMPPPKKPRLSAQEIEAIVWWIEQGASETHSVDAPGVPSGIQALAR
jgi:mono/diheme cytochrome c family protein